MLPPFTRCDINYTPDVMESQGGVDTGESQVGQKERRFAWRALAIRHYFPVGYSRGGVRALDVRSHTEGKGKAPWSV